MMLALGMFVFSLRTAAYQELQRQTDWRHASNNRVGAAPARQFVGRGEDAITLPGIILPELKRWCSTSIPDGSWAGQCLTSLMQNWQSKRWRWPIGRGGVHQACCFTPTRAVNTSAGHFGNDCGAIA